MVECAPLGPRIRAWALAAALAAAGCAPRGALLAPREAYDKTRGETSAPLDVPGVPSATGLELAPDPALQALVDPHRQRGLAWLGGDVATSIPLSRSRWIWLFGDTILGRVEDHCPPPHAYCERRVDPDRVEESIVGNSIGTLRFDRTGRPQPIVKHWRTHAGVPEAIFPGEIEGEIVWPLAGLRIGRSLLVSASRHTREGGLAPFGNVFLRVTNPDDPPERWRTIAYPIPYAIAEPGLTPLAWTTGLVLLGDHVFVIGQQDVGFAARMVIARMPVGHFDRPGWAPHPEYFARARDGGPPTWRADAAMTELVPIPGLPGTSEAVFELHPELGWVTFQIPPLSFEIRMYTAPDLLGPWSERGTVYFIPPPWSTEAQVDCPMPLLACGFDEFATYAAKSHPELAPPGGFAVTFNVNLANGSLETAERAAEEHDAFYVPQFVAGVLPPGAAASARASIAR